MPRAKKTTNSAATKPKIGRPPKSKTTSKVSGLVTSDVSAIPASAMAQGAAPKKLIGRPPGSGAKLPGGNQLPQGSNALRAAILELMRTKQDKIKGPAAEQILKVLIAL